MAVNGVINIYKEKGFTSHDVVAKLRGMLHIKKIGHTGTLDPEAAGVLPVCIGNATKLCDLIMEKQKEYVAELVLGKKTDTYDLTGNITAASGNFKNLKEEDLKEVLKEFIGDINQVPPMYSALKINGKKLYELARAGIEVERKSRPVKIEYIDIISEFCINEEDARVKLKIGCSKGTYIRSLCNDIGEKLGTYGCMGELLRTKSGRFYLEDSIRLSELQKIVDEGALEERKILIKADEVLGYEKIKVKEEYMKLLDNGNSLPMDAFEALNELSEDETFCVYDCNGNFKAVYKFIKAENIFRTEKMFG